MNLLLKTTEMLRFTQHDKMRRINRRGRQRLARLIHPVFVHDDGLACLELFSFRKIRIRSRGVTGGAF